MDVKQVVSYIISLGGLGGLATLIGTIWAIIHGHKKDERQDDEDRRKLDDWLIQKVKVLNILHQRLPIKLPMLIRPMVLLVCIISGIMALMKIDIF
ncbi:hypothetical protein [Lentilactobacillus parakefiri]|uniref:Uncharacterized protein n=1 Tax=Lentilactobacillus parakefiri TaxID=152332 RepID=A0A224VCV6_9LACO|nr:hypothetical protein [Lentilactobacillus parakefiri]KRL70657.1 hypothetical protein FD08_GL000988 [Lentilactobacillus parakefiri DSM 10551]TDG88434.1 hypothetical protein C5L28_000429 [Lentilactobacillus parakefiri]GAW72775.1 hypothetical protein LPKJCM_01905 [Lentilactobacillus parakefiri]